MATTHPYPQGAIWLVSNHQGWADTVPQVNSGWTYQRATSLEELDLRIPAVVIFCDDGSAQALQSISRWQRLARRPVLIALLPETDLKRAAALGRAGIRELLPHPPDPQSLRAAIERSASRGEHQAGELVLASIGVGSLSADFLRLRLRIDETAARLLGRPDLPLELPVDDWQRFIYPPDLPRMQAEFKRMEGGSDHSFLIETRVVLPDQRLRWLRSWGLSQHDESGRLLRIEAALIDVSEWREAQERFQRMAENAPDMIFRWSYRNGFEYVSPAATAIIGFTPEEHYADPGLGYRQIHIEDIPAYESVFTEMFTPERPLRSVVVRWHHRDGHIVHVEIRLTPIFDARGELIAIEGIARDISEHVIAQQRLRELSTRLSAAHEEERRRIAHELHDEVGQMLTVAKMRLQMMENAMQQLNPAMIERISTLEGLVEKMLAMVRDLSHALRPPLLDELGWQPALAALCEGLEARSRVRIHYRHQGPIMRLPAAHEIALFRSAQEALNNALKHAEASLIEVSTSSSPQGILVSVRDDGQGFDPAEVTQHTGPEAGLGLLGLHERLDSVEGWLKIESHSGQGSVIQAWVPLPRSEG